MVCMLVREQYATDVTATDVYALALELGDYHAHRDTSIYEYALGLCAEVVAVSTASAAEALESYHLIIYGMLMVSVHQPVVCFADGYWV